MDILAKPRKSLHVKKKLVNAEIKTNSKMNIKILIMICYSFGFIGIFFFGAMDLFLQATHIMPEIIPGISDRVTMGMIVLGLASANVLQYRQGIITGQAHLKDLKSLLETNTTSMQSLINKIEVLIDKMDNR